MVLIISIGVYWKPSNIVYDLFDYIEKNYKVEVSYYSRDECADRKKRVMDGLKIHDIHWATGIESNPPVINKLFRERKVGKAMSHITFGSNYFSKKIKELNFDLFDMTIVCNEEYLEYFKKQNIPVTFIPNCISPKSIVFDNYKNKFDGQCVAYSLKFSPVKNYPNLVRFFRRVVDEDSKFKLTIKSELIREKENYYNQYKLLLNNIQKENLGNNITIISDRISWDSHWRRNRVDANRVLFEKSAYINFSLWESFSYSTAEALLAGKESFIKNWERGLSPEQFWKPYVYNDERKMVDGLLNYMGLTLNEKRRKAKQNRKYVCDRFSPEKIAKEVVKLIGVEERG